MCDDGDTTEPPGKNKYKAPTLRVGVRGCKCGGWSRDVDPRRRRVVVAVAAALVVGHLRPRAATFIRPVITGSTHSGPVSKVSPVRKFIVAFIIFCTTVGIPTPAGFDWVVISSQISCSIFDTRMLCQSNGPLLVISYYIPLVETEIMTAVSTQVKIETSHVSAP